MMKRRGWRELAIGEVLKTSAPAMLFPIESHLAVGPIRLGMSVNELRQCLGPPTKSFKRSPLSVHPCDVYEPLGVFVYYQADGRVEAVELTRPASPMLGNHDLLEISYQDLQPLIRSLDPTTVFDDDGFTSKKLGIGAYVPSAMEDQACEVESVIVFRPGYYDE